MAANGHGRDWETIRDGHTGPVTMPAAIAELLAGYMPGDGEVAAMDSMTDLLTEGESCWAAGHFEPGHFTASAYVTDPGMTRVLLVHHGQLGRWLQPGGHIEPGDTTPLDAARREVAEETGVTPSAGQLVRIDVHPIPAAGTRPAHLHFDLTFHLLAEPGAVTAGDGVGDARWVLLTDVPDLTDDPSLLAGVRRLSIAP